MVYEDGLPPGKMMFDSIMISPLEIVVIEMSWWAYFFLMSRMMFFTIVAVSAFPLAVRSTLV